MSGVEIGRCLARLFPAVDLVPGVIPKGQQSHGQVPGTNCSHTRAESYDGKPDHLRPSPKLPLSVYEYIEGRSTLGWGRNPAEATWEDTVRVGTAKAAAGEVVLESL